MYISKIPNENGAYSAPQSNKFTDSIALSDELLTQFLKYSGFVNLTIDGETVTDIQPNLEAWEAWKATQPNPLEQLKQEKISALSATCEQTIYAGLELELSEGTERFEYKDKDRENIETMFNAIALGAEKYPYQSEDGKCRVFTKQDIITLYSSLSELKTSQLTYYHQLKDLVNTLTTTEEINAVTYGQELTGEYLEHYNEMMQVAEEQMQLVLSKVV